jgi:indoleamine 2,3-dioxygenase
LFPNGVKYEGTHLEEPQFFMGQTGAQDSLIPMLDSFFGITNYYPDNSLTHYLRALRKYRPPIVQEFLHDLENDYKQIFQTLSAHGAPVLDELYKCIEQVYLFRNGHWMFIQQFIMKETKYPVATGGTPIINWALNQIEACLQYMKDIGDMINDSKYDSTRSKLPDYYRILKSQVLELKKKNFNVNLVYDAEGELAEY